MLNVPKRIGQRFFIGLLLVLQIACGDEDGNGATNSPLRFSADFESGSLPHIRRLDSTGLAWELGLRDDNNNASLPNSFRTWWYVRMDNVPTEQSLRLEVTRLGFNYYFLPLYSYDGQKWQYFNEQEVTLQPNCNVAIPESCRLILNKKFKFNTVWIARTYPYTTQDLASFLATTTASPYIQTDVLGSTPAKQKPIQLITIADHTKLTNKQTVWIHARTHPAETGPSYLLEGLIKAALEETPLGQALRQKYIFKIVPMHNLDGIVLGNYRTNATSINLESQWRFDPGHYYLKDTAPTENRQINLGGMVPTLLNNTESVALALNLHSSNSNPDTAAFFFPHFGSDTAKFTPQQQSLWRKQLRFIKLVAQNYDGKIERPPVEGGAGFLNTYFPETWWWTFKSDAVNAMTLETTYGRAGFDHWITQNDLRNLGVAVAKSINEMSTLGALPKEILREKDMSMFPLPFKPEIYEYQE
ncbi:M14-type cytosolic carboxypeptidase [Chitinimonas sp. BJB300]|uniref:M14-type cytosolic carboxypeptidase n=1 Tax=Chitinimonas sp. BJB300 TaxID=1559339 RepID=UPI000C0F0218|nr:M14-type cytosolic carboxypeptidase [Chitinimonas sp. BJB300]PHV10038.1 hypothetical protein CSQ89_18375 [Chitinimonas sp. BJB300]TSJ83017.1 carboxypeptidase family protein [Chitinimonas sp. BJB300]